MADLHTRRKRRQAKMKLGGKFTVRHRSPSGRTGSVRAKQLKGRTK